MSIWLLVFVIFVGGQGAPVSGTFTTRFDCEVRMGAVVTKVEADKKVEGYVIQSPCIEVQEARKT